MSPLPFPFLPGMRVWGDDTIHKIELLGSSITRVLLMVLHALPRRMPTNKPNHFLFRYSRQSLHRGNSQISLHVDGNCNRSAGFQRLTHGK